MVHHRSPLPGASDRHQCEDTPLHPGLWLWNTSFVLLVWGTPHYVEVRVCAATAVHACDLPLSVILVKQGISVPSEDTFREKRGKTQHTRKEMWALLSQCQRLSLILSKCPRAERWKCSYWAWQCFPLWWKILLVTNFGAQKTYPRTALNNSWVEGEDILFGGHVFNWQDVCSW